MLFDVVELVSIICSVLMLLGKVFSLPWLLAVRINICCNVQYTSKLYFSLYYYVSIPYSYIKYSSKGSRMNINQICPLFMKHCFWKDTQSRPWIVKLEWFLSSLIVILLGATHIPLRHLGELSINMLRIHSEWLIL